MMARIETSRGAARAPRTAERTCHADLTCYQDNVTIAQ